MTERHTHQEGPYCQEDQDFLNKADAEESLYACFALINSKVVGVSICSYLTQVEKIAILEQAIKIIKEEDV